MVGAGKRKLPDDQSFVPYKDDVEEPRLMPENDIHDMSICLVDALINAEVLLPQGEESEGFDERSNLVKAKFI